jgi:hypothetical protein
MYPPLEQAWELKRVGKDVYDFEEEYSAARKPQKDYIPITRGKVTKFSYPPRGPARPPVDPEKLKRVLDDEREADNARRNASHMRQLDQVCDEAADGGPRN